MKDEGKPFSIVLDKILETTKVVKTPIIMVKVRRKVEKRGAFHVYGGRIFV